jgi:hypothetical protein
MSASVHACSTPDAIGKYVIFQGEKRFFQREMLFFLSRFFVRVPSVRLAAQPWPQAPSPLKTKEPMKSLFIWWDIGMMRRSKFSQYEK